MRAVPPWLALPTLLLSVSARLSNPAFPGPVVEPEPGPTFERASLAPYFADGGLAEAKTAFDQGRYSRCRELLAHAETSAPVRFLMALAAEKARDWATAAQEFETLAPEYPPLRDRCLVHAGQAMEQLGQWDGAERVYRQVTAATRLEPDARLGLARSLRALKRPQEALDALGPLVDRPAPPWGRDVGAEALLVQAETLTAMRSLKEAKAAWLSLWSLHPLTREGRRAGERVGEVGEVPQAAVVARAETLVEAHHNAEGEALLAPLVGSAKLPEALACRAGLALGKAQRKQRAHARAITTLSAVVKNCQDPELRQKALYTLGTSQTYAAPSLAAATFERLAEEAQEGSLADDALLFAADARFKQGERDLAVERLLELVDRFPKGEMAADGLFRLFWLHRSEGKLEESLAFLEEIEGRFAEADDSFEVERARYWRGRVLEALGQPAGALALYEWVSREHPATYYGLISRERVEAMDPERGAALAKATVASTEGDDPFPLRLGALSQQPVFGSAVELTRLGLGEQVPLEVLAVDRSKLEAEQVRLLVLLLSLAKEERAAHGLARVWLRADLNGPISRARRALWEIAYPRAFRELVETRAKEADELDPDLLQALMREESALDPKALSWAGALGLCQLMPATAAEVAAKLKLERPSPSGLLEPDLNIRLGGRYLSDLLTRAHGTMQFALAGYNAGEGSVARWRKELGDDALAGWVEQIPIPETRGYVRRVLRSYAAYKLLYDPLGVPHTVQRLAAKPAKRPKS